MSNELEHKITATIEAINDPILGRTFASLNALERITLDGNAVQVDLKLGYKALSLEKRIAMLIHRELSDFELDDVQVNIRGEVVASPTQTSTGHLSKVKNIVTVASGKGGVGKSTTAVNLALALQAEGAAVGLLDADIYGPSQRTMLGVADDVKPELVDEKFLKPIVRMGIKSMSVGYLSEEKAPMIWRGPMATRMLSQLMEQTMWGELDYLVIDMPPGTGDIQISLAQKVSVSGAVIVSTPQQVALIDARKGIEMFNKVGIPVLGVVENMATHICSNCGHEESIFGAHGAEELASQYQVPLLGALPLDRRIRENVDTGSPTVVADPTGNLANAYLSVAHHLAAQQWQQNLTMVATPTIVIGNE